jgi:hypothetical protein
MSSSRLVSRSMRAVATLEPCAFCQARQFTRGFGRNGAAKLSPSSIWRATSIQSRNYATRQRLDGSRARADVDARARLGFYTMSKQQGILKMEPHTADSIYKDFLAHKDSMGYGSSVLRLAQSAFWACVSMRTSSANINRVPGRAGRHHVSRHSHLQDTRH